RDKLVTGVQTCALPIFLLTVGFMAIHNVIIWWRKAQAARRSPHRTLVRMNVNQRIQHLVLLTSFTVLVISGFALAWPDSLFATRSEERRVGKECRDRWS